ncbi:MAG: preprotein translocase subunit YajC [Ignavibacteria bacterium]|nr:preprotein translocase subunit YajC [Ignavibacteria bacterium]
MNHLILLQAAPGGDNMLMSLAPFLLIIVIFYFLIIRPQQKKQKERQTLLAGLKKGDKVVTNAGIHGTVEGLEDQTVLVKVADNVKLKMDRSAISTIMGVTDVAPAKK